MTPNHLRKLSHSCPNKAKKCEILKIRDAKFLIKRHTVVGYVTWQSTMTYSVLTSIWISSCNGWVVKSLMGYDCIIIIIISQEFNPLQMHFILTSFVMLKSLLLMESTWTPGRLHMDSGKTPYGLHKDSMDAISSPPGVYQESTRSPPGVHQDSIRNIRTPSGFHQEYLESIRMCGGM